MLSLVVAIFSAFKTGWFAFTKSRGAASSQFGSTTDVPRVAFVIAHGRGPGKSRESLLSRSYVYPTRSRKEIGCKPLMLNSVGLMEAWLGEFSILTCSGSFRRLRARATFGRAAQGRNKNPTAGTTTPNPPDFARTPRQNNHARRLAAEDLAIPHFCGFRSRHQQCHQAATRSAGR